MEFFDLEPSLKAVASAGNVVNVQELSCLQKTLTELKSQEKYPSIYFWGKLYGEMADYYIAYVLKHVQTDSKTQADLPPKMFFYAGEDYQFKPLPTLTEETVHRILALGLEKRFTGRPEHVLEQEEVDNLPKLTEVQRLAQIVQEIDFDTAVVPKGAYALNAHKVVPNTDFAGLAPSEATKLANYVHFRPPTSIDALRALARTDAEFASKFLDPLEGDLPKKCWALRQDPSAALVTLRSLVWPGYVAFHVPGTAKYGGSYFGTAMKCRDLAFML